MEINSSPTLTLTHGQGQVPQGPPRRSANFHPSVWGDYFLAYASVAMEPEVKTEQRIEQLKEKVREMIVASADKPSQKLSLIDAIQRLGVGYHFETEIDTTLQHIYETNHEIANDEDLYTVALSFRVLRQQGHPVSYDVFNKFKDDEGKFKKSLIGDVRGLLSLYEATHLRVHQEDILDEALEFTTTHLNSALPNLSNNPIAAQVVHALDQPIHLGLTRLESRHYISFYEKDDSHNKVLLDFAKLDFNLLQKLHQRELSEFTRWWKDLDVAGKLPFARDRGVELFFWILGVYYEPQYFPAIRILTKLISLISINDDLYDASNATIEELVIYHDAIQRWDVNAPDQLPDYIKHFYQKILDTYNMIEDEMAKQGRSYRVEYAKSALKDMVRVYLIEAKWYHEGYVPTLEEYMPVGKLSAGLRSLATASLVGMGEVATKEAFDWVISDPLIVEASGVIGRLMDDIVSHAFEQERGHAASAVECYMKQYGATEEEAVAEFQKQVTSAWKDNNSECLRPTAVPMPVLLRVFNVARTFHIVYKDADSYTHSGAKFKEIVTSVLVDSVPI
ncbi:(-)-germacrene D synthase-like isoform X2 [Rhododendron vialii]|uniref:(-)-germacrene D synthase-like isoform X2 n=1 Tax=Rhododendron vialii TaxID=182163 RepID=UPI00265F4B0C|nr:(-)-germacrene D synthase-like isoform X2 [Rhododendron vialii]